MMKNNLFNKQQLLECEYSTFLTTALQVFEYENLPPTITKLDIEKTLFKNGSGCIVEKEKNLYFIECTFGGILDQNNEPTQIIVNNPFLKLSKTLNIKDVIVGYNTSLKKPLIDYIYKNINLLVDTTLTMQYNLITARLNNLITYTDTNQKENIQDIINNCIDSVNIKSLYNSTLIDDGMKIIDLNNNYTNLLNLLELQNFYKSQIYETLGTLSINNMKRESLNENEIYVNENLTKHLINDMYNCRLDFVNALNKKYNLNVQVKINDMFKEKEE